MGLWVDEEVEGICIYCHALSKWGSRATLSVEIDQPILHVLHGPIPFPMAVRIFGTSTGDYGLEHCPEAAKVRSYYE